jgi:hypothetical protein
MARELVTIAREPTTMVPGPIAMIGRVRVS